MAVLESDRSGKSFFREGTRVSKSYKRDWEPESYVPVVDEDEGYVTVSAFPALDEDEGYVHGLCSRARSER